jgi:hypothetical protein
MALNGALLPVRQIDYALMLATGTVLRKQTRQLLREDPDLERVRIPPVLDTGPVARKDFLHRAYTLGHDARVADIEYDPQPEDAPRVIGQATVA